MVKLDPKRWRGMLPIDEGFTRKTFWAAALFLALALLFVFMLSLAPRILTYSDLNKAIEANNQNIARFEAEREKTVAHLEELKKQYLILDDEVKRNRTLIDTYRASVNQYAIDLASLYTRISKLNPNVATIEKQIKSLKMEIYKYEGMLNSCEQRQNILMEKLKTIEKGK
jgi:chromosome segregation ATPase